MCGRTMESVFKPSPDRGRKKKRPPTDKKNTLQTNRSAAPRSALFPQLSQYKKMKSPSRGNRGLDEARTVRGFPTPERGCHCWLTRCPAPASRSQPSQQATGIRSMVDKNRRDVGTVFLRDVTFSKQWVIEPGSYQLH